MFWFLAYPQRKLNSARERSLGQHPHTRSNSKRTKAESPPQGRSAERYAWEISSEVTVLGAGAGADCDATGAIRGGTVRRPRCPYGMTLEVLTCPEVDQGSRGWLRRQYRQLCRPQSGRPLSRSAAVLACRKRLCALVAPGWFSIQVSTAGPATDTMRMVRLTRSCLSTHYTEVWGRRPRYDRRRIARYSKTTLITVLSRTLAP